VMNVHNMTWVHMLLGGVERVHDVREIGLQREQAAGTGKQANMTISARQGNMGVHGDIMEHCGEVLSDGRAWRAVVWHRRYLPASCCYRNTSEAFLSGLIGD